MRVIESAEYRIKRKIPFSEWADIVHTFLEAQGLSYKKFYYYFEDLIDAGDKDEYDYAVKKGPCAKILKDCPKLGEIQFHNETEYTDIIYISNIEKPTMCTEADLLPLMKKIHRNYGFSECNIYFGDINYFDRLVPAEDKPVKSPQMYQVCGSAIQLHKDCQGLNYIVMSIDILEDENLLDATPYFEAMSKLLPGVRYYKVRRIELSEEEEKIIAEQNKTAIPLVEKCKNYLKERLSMELIQNYDNPKYSCAQALKKCAKGTGFVYESFQPYLYRLNKNTLRNHALTVEVFAGPGHYSVEFEILFKGAAFKHVLGVCSYAPQNQKDLEMFIESLLQILKEFENGPMIELDEHYQHGIYYDWK